MKLTPVTEHRLKEILVDYPTKQDLQNVLQDFRDQIFERLDDISGQLETIREEQTIGYHQFKQLENKVEKHETRITALESSHS